MKSILTQELYAPQAIWSTDRAFLAKLCDQTFTAWGEKSSGADISTVKPKLDSIGVEAPPLLVKFFFYLKHFFNTSMLNTTNAPELFCFKAMLLTTDRLFGARVALSLRSSETAPSWPGEINTVVQI